jgi:hypothetical protein
MFEGTCSLRVVCQPALSSVSTAWATGGDASADLVEVMLHGAGTARGSTSAVPMSRAGQIAPNT